MEAHTNIERHTMFQKATDQVKDQLDSMGEDIQELLDDYVQTLAKKMKRDYLAVLVGDGARAQTVAERMLRHEVCKPLAEADSWFAALLSPGGHGLASEAVRSLG